MDKQELGAFLRSRRERLRPEDVGLPSGPRRRTPGLRREEIAVLAHISTEYYVRLEQGRAPRPSGEVLAGIAGALRLTDTESDHLHVLAGTAPTRTGLHRRDVRPSILALLERLPQTAAFVTSAAFEVLAWNDGSPQFARLWERHDVQAAPTLTKTFRHPVVGEVTVDCDSLALTDRDQHLVLYSAPSGSRSAEALALLNVLGTESINATRTYP
jgi:transcriptional regulator with XRE-family HTH domain